MASIITRDEYCNKTTNAKRVVKPKPLPGCFYWYRWQDHPKKLRFCIYADKDRTSMGDPAIMVDPETGQQVGSVNYTESRTADGSYTLADDVQIVTGTEGGELR